MSAPRNREWTRPGSLAHVKYQQHHVPPRYHNDKKLMVHEMYQDISVKANPSSSIYQTRLSTLLSNIRSQVRHCTDIAYFLNACSWLYGVSYWIRINFQNIPETWKHQILQSPTLIIEGTRQEIVESYRVMNTSELGKINNAAEQFRYLLKTWKGHKLLLLVALCSTPQSDSG